MPDSTTPRRSVAERAGNLWRDLVYAARTLGHHRAASIVAVLSIAIAIGPNSAIFSIMERVFLPGGLAGASDSLLGLRTHSAAGYDDLSYPEYRDLAEGTRSFARLVASYRRGAVLNVAGSTELVVTSLVAADYFAAVGAGAHKGRVLEARDDAWPDSVPAVISDDLWRRRFGGSAQIVGQSIDLDGHSVTVVGVAEPGFRDLNLFAPVDVWLPLEGWMAVDPGAKGLLSRRETRALQVMGELRPGIRKADAQDELRAVSARLARDFPATSAGRTLVAWSARDDDRRKRIGVTAVTLSLAGLVLLVACTNVGTMLLARAEGRRRETALRLAIGANRWDLFRLLVAEALLLALAASALGLLFAHWLLRLTSALKPVTMLPIVFDFAISWPVVLYTGCLAFVTTLACSLTPLWQSAPSDLVSALKGSQADGARQGVLRSRFATLMTMQIFVTQVLLCGGGLLLRSYQHTLAAPAGIDIRKPVLMLTLVARPRQAGAVPATQHYYGVADAIAALPGVRRASFVDNPPLSGQGDSILQIERDDGLPGVPPIRVRTSTVGTGYFELLGARVPHGRTFVRSDAGRDVVIANEAFVRAAFVSMSSPADAIGRRLRAGARMLEVIGVAEDGKFGSLREAAQPHAFVPAPEATSAGTTLLVETSGPSESMAPAARKVVQDAVPGVWIAHVVTLQEHVRAARILDEFGAMGVGALGLLALLLAAVGLFGLAAFWVQRRMKECGIRMALGAEPREVMALLQWQILRPVLVGVVLGLAGGVVVGRVMASLLFGVEAYDPMALGGAALFSLVVSAIATRIPTRRCRSIVLNTVLREE